MKENIKMVVDNVIHRHNHCNRLGFSFEKSL